MFKVNAVLPMSGVVINNRWINQNVCLSLCH